MADTQADVDDRNERAHGGIVQVNGDIATLGDGSRWWLNGEPWARDAAQAAMHRQQSDAAAYQARRRSQRA